MFQEKLFELQEKAEDIAVRAMLELKPDIAEEVAKIWDNLRFGKILLDDAVTQIEEVEKKLAA